MERKKLVKALETTISALKMETAAAGESLLRAIDRTPKQLHDFGYSAQTADANAAATGLILQSATANRVVKKLGNQLKKTEKLLETVKANGEYKLYEPRTKEFTVEYHNAEGEKVYSVIGGSTYRSLRFIAGSRESDTVRIVNGEGFESLMHGIQGFIVGESAPLINTDGEPISFKLNRLENKNEATGVVRPSEEFTFTAIVNDKGVVTGYSVATPFSGESKIPTLRSIAQAAINAVLTDATGEAETAPGEATEQPHDGESKRARRKAHGKLQPA